MVSQSVIAKRGAPQDLPCHDSRTGVDARFSSIGPLHAGATESESSINQYRFYKEVGQGKHAVVRHAVDSHSNSNVAIKIIKKEKLTRALDILGIHLEICYMERMSKHPNFIEFYEKIHTKKHIYIVMQLGDMDLFAFIDWRGRRLEEEEAQEITYGIVLGMLHLHANEACHLDLKPENILLCGIDLAKPASHKSVRIADLGFVGEADMGSCLLRGMKGSCGFFSPEMMQGFYEGLFADVWSLGCIIMEMLLGQQKFEHIWLASGYGRTNDKHLFATDVKEAHTQVLSIFTKEEEVGGFLRKCLAMDPRKRSAFSELEAHPWFEPVKEKMKEASILHPPRAVNRANRKYKSPVQVSERAGSRSTKTKFKKAKASKNDTKPNSVSPNWGRVNTPPLKSHGKDRASPLAVCIPHHDPRAKMAHDHVGSQSPLKTSTRKKATKSKAKQTEMSEGQNKLKRIGQKKIIATLPTAVSRLFCLTQSQIHRRGRVVRKGITNAVKKVGSYTTRPSKSF
jgi:serine/threonine protein kinase